MNKIMGLLTIARRASKLALGFDMAKDACKLGNARCVCIADDISSKSLKEVKYVCRTEGVPLYSLAMTMDEVGEQLGKKVGVIAVLDSGFYKKAKTLIEEISLDDITY
ncbi:MAG: ribosomal L7Ae/L30e/S12e/Gadd45 family protein [Ruminococcus sp.]|nr:ribosomal L7Ae/L30e/S12e/Gadd45 family protein [Ruminococcus sp.]